MTRGDIVLADEDGLLFLAGGHLDDALTAARSIWQTERRQAALIKDGKTLREQLRFREYPAKRESDPTYTFRRHLRNLGAAIEE